MVEYANIRLTLSCFRARRLPIVIVAADKTATIKNQSIPSKGSASILMSWY